MAYDAVAFLEGLFTGAVAAGTENRGVTVAPHPAPSPGIGPDDLPGDWRVEWEERAAVREFDGGQSREHAEAEALTEIVARIRAEGQVVGISTCPNGKCVI